ncbi:all trans-polyprenyl-diphosphate synthase PDSS2-like [Argiope bruennichi]|uniref:Decaprenyl-diphosphate synthase subunit 2 like protein n=1 Tax=Argiope bruennichi TaxID=94029 RepID=A0A8T0FYJ6_ARGBR|nr:all trans-polyprenyl-diphosphate synthase PDSS2-like [Argiope bruennichi]KAF8795335.1 Decaprenyl-diphosphate synthase subunit 2 like protein [Argiope bruennichi]
MLAFKCWWRNGIFTCLPRVTTWHQYSTSLNPKVKLCEVPGVCSSEEWNSVVRESCAALQNLAPLNRMKRHQTSTVSMHRVIRRLQQSSRNNDYLINTFKQLLTNSEVTSTELRWPGLITLLLSRSIGNPFEANNFVSKALEDVIWSSQVTLAEIVNLLYCNFLFQKENQRLTLSKRTGVRRGATKNEVDRLVNHYFICSVLRKMSSLENDKVLFLFAKVLESFATARSSSEVASHCIHNLKTWEQDTFYPQGLLLATGCQSTLELAGYDEKFQQLAFEFGRYFTLAIKANAEIQQFLNYQTALSSVINVSSFPVALHLSNNPETLAYLYRCRQTLSNLDYSALNAILITNATMDNARKQLKAYVEKATSIFQEFHNFENLEVAEHLMKLVRTLENINE